MPKYHRNPFVSGTLTHESTGSRTGYGYIGKDIYGRFHNSPVLYATEREAKEALMKRKFKPNPASKTASWVIREKATKKVVMETYDKRKVRALNKAKYEAVPILKYLQDFNAKVKGNPMKKAYRKNPDHKTADKHAATELALYAVNDGQLYRSKTTAIINNLSRKSKKGVYNIDLAAKAWEYLAKDAALKYMREFGSRGDTVQGVFNAATRRAAAVQLEQEYREEVIEKAKSL